MIILCTLLVALWLADYFTDWVTPYLEQVEREQGVITAVSEGLEIMRIYA